MNNNINLIKLINSASKTLNLVNELIPVYKKVQPIIKKTKTFLDNQPIKISKDVTSTTPQKENNLPTFFQ